MMKIFEMIQSLFINYNVPKHYSGLLDEPSRLHCVLCIITSYSRVYYVQLFDIKQTIKTLLGCGPIRILQYYRKQREDESGNVSSPDKLWNVPKYSPVSASSLPLLVSSGFRLGPSSFRLPTPLARLHSPTSLLNTLHFYLFHFTTRLNIVSFFIFSKQCSSTRACI